MKTANPIRLENKQVKEVFLLMIKGIEKPLDMAKILKLNRCSIYDGINELLSLKIIRKKDKNKGFILNKKIAKKYVNSIYNQKLRKFNEEIKEIKKMREKLR